MGSGQIILAAAVVLIPLAIAVAVTLWTLEPAARRAERAKRGRRPASGSSKAVAQDEEPLERDTRPSDAADRDP